MNISDTIIIIYISIISPLLNKSSMQRDNVLLAMRGQQEGKEQKIWVLSVQDHFSKYVWLRLLKGDAPNRGTLAVPRFSTQTMEKGRRKRKHEMHERLEEESSNSWIFQCYLLEQDGHVLW
jgi:hypothetical protein